MHAKQLQKKAGIMEFEFLPAKRNVCSPFFNPPMHESLLLKAAREATRVIACIDLSL